MLELGVIELSKSQQTLPIIPVGKNDVSMRVCLNILLTECCDNRQMINVSIFYTATIEDQYQKLRVDKLINNLGQAKYISTLEKAKGYYQVLVRLEDRDKAVFVMPFSNIFIMVPLVPLTF